MERDDTARVARTAEPRRSDGGRVLVERNAGGELLLAANPDAEGFLKANRQERHG